MRLFPKRFSVCEQCRVHFDPYDGPGSRLCENHRAEWLAMEVRRCAVIAWATANWEKLEQQVNEERAAFAQTYAGHMQAHYANLQQAQQGSLAGYGDILGMAGGSLYGHRPFNE